MKHLLLIIIVILLLIILALCAKVYFLRKSAQEIAQSFRDRLGNAIVINRGFGTERGCNQHIPRLAHSAYGNQRLS